MRFQAVIHYKNDEEDQSPIVESFYEAFRQLTLMIEVNSANDGFNPEDVQFAQVQTLED